RNLDRRKMRVTELVGPARRMQWIREQQESITLESVRGQHRRCPSTHGSSADYQLLRLDLLAHARDDGSDALLEPRHRVRAAGLFLFVEEVEADDAEPPRAESVRGLNDAAVVHVSARAMRADEDDVLLRSLGWLKYRRRLSPADPDSPLGPLRLDR